MKNTKRRMENLNLYDYRHVEDHLSAMAAQRPATTAELLETEPKSATPAEIAEMVAYNELPAEGTPGYVYVAVEKDESAK